MHKLTNSYFMKLKVLTQRFGKHYSTGNQTIGNVKMSNSLIKGNFVKSVLQNGIGRHVCQLQRLTLKFCKSEGGSRGMRDYVEGELLHFSRQNPGIVIYVQPRRHRTPVLVGEYLNGKTASCPTKNFTTDEIAQWVEHLRTRSGVEIERLMKTWHTDSPSIQGIWTPFTNRDTSTTQREFPDSELSEFIPLETSAQEKLLKFYEMQSLSHIAETDKDMSKELKS